VSEAAGPPSLAQDPSERTFVGVIEGIDQRFEECLGEEVLIEWTNVLKFHERRDATGNTFPIQRQRSAEHGQRAHERHRLA
jgi:hypothetical protein